MTKEEMDMVFNLFCNQADTSNEWIVESCLYFVRQYDFDYEELPDELMEMVEENMLAEYVPDPEED